MGKIYVLDHPLLQHKLSILRNKDTGVKEFREIVGEIAALMCYEATRNLPTEDVEVETPIGLAHTKILAGKKMAIVPILRAGLGMVDSIIDLIPSAKVGHVGLFRDPETHEPVKYYCKMPPDIAERQVFVVDPMLATGGSAIVGITLGEGDKARADRYFSLFMSTALIVGIVLSVLGMLLLRPVALMLGAEGEMLDYALRYGRVLMLSLPTFILQNMFQSFFVTAEKPHLGFYFTVGAGCTNMVLDVLLVGILHWSVEGAAIATMLSQVVGGLLPVFYFLNRKNTSLLHLCRPQFEGGVLLKACVNGSSELMTNLSMSLVNILYNYQLLRFAGEDGVAAYGVIMYASFLFVAVFVGYAVGSAPIVSYHYGANNRKEVNNLYRKSLKLIGVVAVVMTIGSMFIIPHVARFFVGYDENLLILTTRAFRLYGLSFLIMGFNVYASSFFTALGDGVTSALISFLRTLLFQVAAVLLLPLLLGIDGIWLAVTAAELAALLVSIGLFITRDQQFHYRKAE